MPNTKMTNLSIISVCAHLSIPLDAFPDSANTLICPAREGLSYLNRKAGVR
jgi:hypothetical protein